MKYEDLKYHKIGHMLCLEFHSINKFGRAKWLCHCDCGTEKVVNASDLKNGSTTSCGCIKRKNLVGQKFNRLLVVKIDSIDKNGNVKWLCKCDCGKPVIVLPFALKNGQTKSCGCLKQAIMSRKTGKQHHNWRHDLLKKDRENNKNRNLNPKVRIWRNKVYKRDNYTCQVCGNKRNKKLNAHHIYSWHSYPKLRHVTNNGITLCVSCHKKFHQMYGFKNNTRKQFNIFRNNINIS